jgi:hypothetical protein
MQEEPPLLDNDVPDAKRGATTYAGLKAVWQTVQDGKGAILWTAISPDDRTESSTAVLLRVLHWCHGNQHHVGLPGDPDSGWPRFVCVDDTSKFARFDFSFLGVWY